MILLGIFISYLAAGAFLTLGMYLTGELEGLTLKDACIITAIWPLWLFT
jgi:hypothetical protein